MNNKQRLFEVMAKLNSDFKITIWEYNNYDQDELNQFKKDCFF